LPGRGYPIPSDSRQGATADAVLVPVDDTNMRLTSVRLQATVVLMRIRSFAHKGLKALYEEDSSKGVTAMPIKNPPYPGDFIRTEIIALTGLSVTAAATALGVSRPTLSSLLNGKAGLSGDMALRIEKAFAVKMDTLMRMQSSYDIAQTRRREKQIRVRRIQQLVNAHA
jgi:addiction module HigA family antidote